VDGARAFAELWEQHTQFFVDVAHADRMHVIAKAIADAIVAQHPKTVSP